jgi:hypothetical protein
MVTRSSTHRIDNTCGPHGTRGLAGRLVDPQCLLISDYFLNEDSFGKVHAEGDHRVHVVRVHGNDMNLDPRFQLNFDTAFPTGPARPHGVVFK